jgi:hypothetical protein
MEPINGKVYPMWEQFVEKKAQWIGGVLEDMGDDMDRNLAMGETMSTIITDIVLKPNGTESAFFEIVGEKFECGSDVRHLGIWAGEKGWLTFRGYMGHTFRIKTTLEARQPPQQPPQ